MLGGLAGTTLDTVWIPAGRSSSATAVLGAGPPLNLLLAGEEAAAASAWTCTASAAPCSRWWR